MLNSIYLSKNIQCLSYLLWLIKMTPNYITAKGRDISIWDSFKLEWSLIELGENFREEFRTEQKEKIWTFGIAVACIHTDEVIIFLLEYMCIQVTCYSCQFFAVRDWYHLAFVYHLRLPSQPIPTSQCVITFPQGSAPSSGHTSETIIWFNPLP